MAEVSAEVYTLSQIKRNVIDECALTQGVRSGRHILIGELEHDFVISGRIDGGEDVVGSTEACSSVVENVHGEGDGVQSTSKDVGSRSEIIWPRI